MYKIAILGCENSHADAFLNYIKEGGFTDIEVVGVYSDDEDAIARMKRDFGVYCAKSYDEFVGKIDGVLVTARHGANHLKYALPYFESGIPMFIDKPITASATEAIELAGLLKKNAIRFTGGSSCIHATEVRELKAIAEAKSSEIINGYVRAPISMDNIYGGFWFYSQHLVQIMQEIFGYYPTSVTASCQGISIHLTVKYATYTVFATYTDGVYTYSASVGTKDGEENRSLTIDNSVFRAEFDEFYSLLKGGDSKQSIRDFISPVFVLDAIERAIASGCEEAVIAIPEEV